MKSRFILRTLKKFFTDKEKALQEDIKSSLSRFILYALWKKTTSMKASLTNHSWESVETINLALYIGPA